MHVNVSNFGPIHDAKISIKPITFLVGPNNSGKSYFARALYSLFREMNRDHLSEYVSRTSRRARVRTRVLSNSIKHFSQSDSEFINKLNECLDAAIDRARDLGEYLLSEKLETLEPVVEAFQEANDLITDYRQRNSGTARKLSDAERQRFARAIA